MATGATAEMKASAEGSFWARAFYFHCTSTYILYSYVILVLTRQGELIELVARRAHWVSLNVLVETLPSFGPAGPLGPGTGYLMAKCLFFKPILNSEMRTISEM